MAAKFDLFAVLTVGLGEREYFGNRTAVFCYKAALISIFEVETNNFVEGT